MLAMSSDMMIFCTVLPWAMGSLGAIYLASALVLGAIFMWGALRVQFATEWVKPAWWLYAYSLLYLALLFAAMVADRAFV